MPIEVLGIGFGMILLRLLTDFLTFEDLEPLRLIRWTLGDMALSEFFLLTDLLDRTDLTRPSIWFHKDLGVSELDCF